MKKEEQNIFNIEVEGIGFLNLSDRLLRYPHFKEAIHRYKEECFEKFEYYFEFAFLIIKKENDMLKQIAIDGNQLIGRIYTVEEGRSHYIKTTVLKKEERELFSQCLYFSRNRGQAHYVEHHLECCLGKDGKHFNSAEHIGNLCGVDSVQVVKTPKPLGYWTKKAVEKFRADTETFLFEGE